MNKMTRYVCWICLECGYVSNYGVKSRFIWRSLRGHAVRFHNCIADFLIINEYGVDKTVEIRAYDKELVGGNVRTKLGRNKTVTITDMYSLDWKQILSRAIQSRPTSWRVENPVTEYRNASDCIASEVIQEMKKNGLIKEI